MSKYFVELKSSILNKTGITDVEHIYEIKSIDDPDIKIEEVFRSWPNDVDHFVLEIKALGRPDYIINSRWVKQAWIEYE